MSENFSQQILLKKISTRPCPKFFEQTLNENFSSNFDFYF